MTQIHSRPLLLRSSMSAKINPLGVDNGGRRHCAHVSSVFLYLYSQKFSLSPSPLPPRRKNWPLKETRRTCGFTTTGKYPFCPPGGGGESVSHSPPSSISSPASFGFFSKLVGAGLGGRKNLLTSFLKTQPADNWIPHLFAILNYPLIPLGLPSYGREPRRRVIIFSQPGKEKSPS